MTDLKNLRKILIPISWIYGWIMEIRNLLFNTKIKSIYTSKVPVISVGNLSTGGTGKTPHVDFLTTHFKKKYAVTILSRGYGRKTKGFLLATAHSNAETIGDEPLFYKNKHKEDIQVVVCEDRALGAQKIEKQIKETELILLDDAYQHRKIHRDCNILLTDFNQLFTRDYVLPAGNLREFRKQKSRADVVLITKTPENTTSAEKQKIIKELKLDVPAYFSQITYGPILPVNNFEENKFGSANDTPTGIVLVTGIANPKPLVEQLEKSFEIDLVSFSDHHQFTPTDISEIHRIFDIFAHEKKAIVTTEKDFMRLLHPSIIKRIQNYPWYYQSIGVEIDQKESFIKTVEKYVSTNK
ncbi:MAG: tetraacyldisaccharide 4'-kinase [Lishizhenia sp.]